jgi:hypothetical protein
MYEDIKQLIKKCRDSLGFLGESCQKYISLHDDYLDKYVKDSDILKDKIKAKIARIVNDE